MKPFVAITVLVAASLTATSAAPAQQQVALGSRPVRPRQSSLASGSLSPQGGLQSGVFGQASLPGGSWWSGASSGGQLSSGVYGRPIGFWPGQVSGAGNYWVSQYPQYQQGYYYPYGPSFYAPGYGNYPSWGYAPGYGSNGFWGSAANGFSGVPSAGVGLGGFGSSLANLQGHAGVGQQPTGLPGVRVNYASGQSLQSPVGRQ